MNTFTKTTAGANTSSQGLPPVVCRTSSSSSVVRHYARRNLIPLHQPDAAEPGHRQWDSVAELLFQPGRGVCRPEADGQSRGRPPCGAIISWGPTHASTGASAVEALKNVLRRSPNLVAYTVELRPTSDRREPGRPADRPQSTSGRCCSKRDNSPRACIAQLQKAVSLGLQRRRNRTGR